jgi:hypothetical protein
MKLNEKILYLLCICCKYLEVQIGLIIMLRYKRQRQETDRNNTCIQSGSDNFSDCARLESLENTGLRVLNAYAGRPPEKMFMCLIFKQNLLFIFYCSLYL